MFVVPAERHLALSQTGLNIARHLAQITQVIVQEIGELLELVLVLDVLEHAGEDVRDHGGEARPVIGLDVVVLVLQPVEADPPTKVRIPDTPVDVDGVLGADFGASVDGLVQEGIESVQVCGGAESLDDLDDLLLCGSGVQDGLEEVPLGLVALSDGHLVDGLAKVGVDGVGSLGLGLVHPGRVLDLGLGDAGLKLIPGIKNEGSLLAFLNDKMRENYGKKWTCWRNELLELKKRQQSWNT